MLLFLEANVIFAAAATPKSRTQALLQFAAKAICKLVSSRYTIDNDLTARPDSCKNQPATHQPSLPGNGLLAQSLLRYETGGLMNIHTEIILNAPATDAWRVLGEQFGAIGAWSVSIRTSSLQGELGVGAVRTCQGVGFGPFPAGQVTEKLTHFDPKTMSFTYIGTSGLPWFIKRASNAWSIEAWSPDRCRVRSHAKVELIWWLRPLGFLLPRLARRDMNLFTEELKHQIEQGHAHPRKLATLPA